MENHDIFLGYRHGYGAEYPVALSLRDRRQHLYVVGETGTGKSTLLENLVVQDIEAGRGVAFIDPHGDSSVRLLDAIPRHRIEDVVYFDPSDFDHPIAWNLLKADDERSRHLVASGIVGALKSIWRDSWGPRLEYILYATIATLLECENTSLLGATRLLTDARYRTWALRQVKDPALINFCVRGFAGLMEAGWRPGVTRRRRCWRRLNFDHLCRFNFDQGFVALRDASGCG